MENHVGATWTTAWVSFSAFCSLLIQRCNLVTGHTEMAFSLERGCLVRDGMRVEANMDLGGDGK